MIRFFVFTLLFVFVFTVNSSDSHAQYRGSLQFQNEKDKDEAARPVPRVFSSKVNSVDQAEKLDVILNNLYVSLWNFSGTDFIYQKKLYSLLDFQRFKLTRYPAEFEGVIAESLTNINENYAKIQTEVANAKASYMDIREGIMDSDYETLDPLWEEEITKFEEHADTYFKMQHSYLKTYNSLVKFILRQGGSYYYDATSQSLRFYQNSTKQFFGKSYDKLRKISFEQRKLLRSRPPANVDLTFIK